MKNIEILNLNINLVNKILPKNIYVLRILDNKENIIYDIAVNHIGYCPTISTERDQSKFNDYLANLEYEVIDEFFISSKLKKPKNYERIFEIMTSNDGQLCHYSKAIS